MRCLSLDEKQLPSSFKSLSVLLSSMRKHRIPCSFLFILTDKRLLYHVTLCLKKLNHALTSFKVKTGFVQLYGTAWYVSYYPTVLWKKIDILIQGILYYRTKKINITTTIKKGFRQMKRNLVWEIELWSRIK